MKRLIPLFVVLVVLACMAGAIILAYNRRMPADYHAVQIGWTTEQVRQTYGEPQNHFDWSDHVDWLYSRPTTQNMFLSFYDKHVHRISVEDANKTSLRYENADKF